MSWYTLNSWRINIIQQLKVNNQLNINSLEQAVVKDRAATNHVLKHKIQYVILSNDFLKLHNVWMIHFTQWLP